MKKAAFKRQLLEVLNSEVEGLSWDDKAAVAKQCLIDVGLKQLDLANKGKTWTDEELQLVLSLSPTKENCLKLARAFKRGYGSIEQIYRWAASTEDEINEKRPDDAFLRRIKRVARSVGWRAT